MKKSKIQDLQRHIDDYVDILVAERDGSKTTPARRKQLVRDIDHLRQLNRELSRHTQRTRITAIIREIIELITRLS